MSKDVKVEYMKNGPIILNGVEELTYSSGEKIVLENGIAYLCRCGNSKNKPFCDGQHKKTSFDETK